jgi:orotate phosphoribosyltransferase-like protein
VTIETTRKLRKRGLSDEEIAEILNLSLEEVKVTN